MPTRDASSPGLVTTTSASNNIDSGTTASFSPPADSWIFVNMGGNNVGSGETFNAPTNTGTALSWTKIGSVTSGPAGGGSSVVWRAYNANAQTGITVTCTISGTGNTFTGNSTQMVVDVWTGCNTVQTSAQVATGTSSTQNISPTITTTASGSRVAGQFSDWNGTGTPTSSDTINAGTVVGETSGGRVYKASDSGAPGSVAVNANAGAAGPSWTYVLYEILAAATASATSYGTPIIRGPTPGLSPGQSPASGRFYQSPKAQNAIFFKALEGVAVTSTAATGNVLGGGVLSGISVASTVSTGNTQGAGVLSGVAVATANSAGPVLGAGALSGVSVTFTVDAGDLQPFAGGAIAGTAASTTNAIGNLAATGILSGAATVGSITVGGLGATGVLSGIASVNSEATGNLSGAGILGGDAVATSILTADFTGSNGTLSGVALAATFASGDLQQFNAGSIAGSSIFSAYALGEMTSTFIQPAGGSNLGGNLGGSQHVPGESWSGKFEFSRRKTEIGISVTDFGVPRETEIASQSTKIEEIPSNLSEIESTLAPLDDDEEAILLLLH